MATLRSALANKSVTNAVLQIKQSGNYYGTSGATYMGCRPASENVNSVFPNKTLSGNTLQATDITKNVSFAKAYATVKLSCTNSLKYALDNYGTSGAFALWIFDTNPCGMIGFGSTATLIMTVDDKSVVQGAAKPTIPASGGVTFANSHSSYSALGAHVQGYNAITATGHATIDSAKFPNLAADYTLTLADASGNVIYQATQTNDQSFDIPPIKVSGVIRWTYSVLDTAGGSATASGAGITLVAYSPPRITNLSAERYSARPTDTGAGVIYAEDPSGEYVRFSFTASTTAVNGKNAWSVSVKATNLTGGSGNQASKQIYSGTGASGSTGITKTDDQTPYSSVTFSAQYDWRFDFTITDKLTSATYSAQVSKAVSILNVESGGVAVGGFLSTGNAFANNNILRGTGNQTQLVGEDQSLWSNGTWDIRSGGNGTASIIPVADCPDGALSGFRITGNTSGNRDIGQNNVPYVANQQYTISCWARVPSGTATLYVRSRDNTNSKQITCINKAITNTTWQHYSGTFTFNMDPANSSAQFGLTGAGTIELCGFKLEKGAINNPVWTPAPQDHAEVTPFSQPKRFETSDDCGAILRGGLWDGRGYRMDYVNNTTLMEYPEGFEPYATMGTDYSDNRIPMISRVGPIVFMEGTLRATKAGTLDFDGIKICTLPSWARPRMTVSQVCQGTSVNIFWLRVEPNGDVIFSRYRTAGTYTNYAVNTQFMFTLSWLAADAAPPLPSIS